MRHFILTTYPSCHSFYIFEITDVGGGESPPGGGRPIKSPICTELRQLTAPYTICCIVTTFSNPFSRCE